MNNGFLEAVYIAEKFSGSVDRIREAELIAGRGIVGDRYFCQYSTDNQNCKSNEQITLIALEDLLRINTETGINLLNGQHRRNVVSRGIDLKNIIGRHIKIGAVKIFVIEPCDPCIYLEEITTEGVLIALTGRGGVRGVIIQSGFIRENDTISIVEF